MAEYFIHEDGDVDMGFSWDLFQREGDRVVRIATFYGEVSANKFLHAINWYETFEDGKMSVPKAKEKALKIIFTPEKKRTRK